jgi:glycyl-tRNA synthetase beta chain
MERGSETLLIEIGCEEIPARMIADAAADLARLVDRLLEQAGLAAGSSHAFGGARRLAVRVEGVPARQADRDEVLLGPPVAAARGADGGPTPAALGFARKHAVDPSQLAPIETERGAYIGFRRRVEGQTLEQLLARTLGPAVAAMSFPKTMRWGRGDLRWVRPVHWLVALHGSRVLEIEVLGAAAAGASRGHRFLHDRPVPIPRAADYATVLEGAHVVVESATREARLAEALEHEAHSLGGRAIDDSELLREVAQLVEWPGVVTGRFDPSYLELPRELLVTTLRHHQKCFAAQDASGRLLPAFLAVTNSDGDRAGHVRRGNEWVVGGRLEDARFFWREDRRVGLAALAPRLASVVFHHRAGSYADKAARTADLAEGLARRLGLAEDTVRACRRAAELAKCDLVSGTVREFPELQGQVGGLLLAAEGEDAQVSRAVYEHYRPAGPADEIPAGEAGRIVSIADKLDSLTQLLRAGERASGSRDPLGLRRAGNGIARILLASPWALGLADLGRLAGDAGATLQFLLERAAALLRETGFTAKEILAVTRPRIDAAEAGNWPLPDVRARLEALRRVRHREDFRHLVKLTERVDNILTKNTATIREIAAAGAGTAERAGEPDAAAERELVRLVAEHAPAMQAAAERGRYDDVVEDLSRFIEPVERFFDECLVVDPAQPAATRRRLDLLVQLNRLFTRYFDIRELAGDAEESHS